MNMRRRISLYLACMLLVAWGASAFAIDYYKTADNLAVYFAVIPSELMGHSPEHPEKVTHAGTSAERRQHHVVVALFDTKTGRRITDADVTATVGEPGLTPSSKKLERMFIAGTVSYGNFFPMSNPYQYRFAIQVRLHGAQERTVNFEFQHPR